MTKKLQIEIIITGGTIDSYYDVTKDTVVPSDKSAVPSFLKSLKINDIFSFHEVCMKDSRSINNKDLGKVLNIINKTHSKEIIITHGTYTMPDTARFLSANMKSKDKVVVLTGSMIPLIGFSPSDAPFNLGYSLASVKTLKPGVYVCMNGEIFSSNEVAKRVLEGKFVSVFNKN
ncbi:MAG: asparaginase domain-containing protein [Candidatus Nomurabacteria bacterium]|nr:asparaginase domain-containing protein [Candidatus Nomurabacteria bacterium]